MSMTIKINGDDGKAYTLAFTKRTINSLAESGFKIESCVDNPVVGVPKLFAGAFLRFHRTITNEQIDAIWATIADKEGFTKALVDMYAEQVNALFAEPGEDAKKATWEIVK
jgi:hypothetical protein